MRDFALAAHEFCQITFLLTSLPALSEVAAPAETGASFEENALLKARYYSAFSEELVVADDSGLEVEALGGAPGVLSARFAGTGATDAENNALLLQRMRGICNRDARFVCVLALARAGKEIATFRGEVQGLVLDEGRGKAGFGYDPLFFMPAFGKSFGELAGADKLRVSHRGEALRHLFGYLSGIEKR